MTRPWAYASPRFCTLQNRGGLALYQKVLIGFPQTIDKLEFYEFSTHAVILSAARSAKSKNLRNYQLHSTNQV